MLYTYICAETLYSGLLGATFESLDAGVRDAHRVPQNARGSFSAQRGQGRVARLVADMMKVPKEGYSIDVCLAVTGDAASVRWRRSFDGNILDSVQTRRGDLLVERVGAASMGFRLTANQGALRYEQVRFWVGPFPVPAWLAPRVRAVVSEAGDGWRVEVVVTAPLLGLICRYGGEVAAE